MEGIGGHLCGGFWRVAEGRLGGMANEGVNGYAQLWFGVGVGIELHEGIHAKRIYS
jgi:hypothetical protein